MPVRITLLKEYLATESWVIKNASNHMPVSNQEVMKPQYETRVFYVKITSFTELKCPE